MKHGDEFNESADLLISWIFRLKSLNKMPQLTIEDIDQIEMNEFVDLLPRIDLHLSVEFSSMNGHFSQAFAKTIDWRRFIFLPLFLDSRAFAKEIIPNQWTFSYKQFSSLTDLFGWLTRTRSFAIDSNWNPFLIKDVLKESNRFEGRQRERVANVKWVSSLHEKKFDWRTNVRWEKRFDQDKLFNETPERSFDDEDKDCSNDHHEWDQRKQGEICLRWSTHVEEQMDQQWKESKTNGWICQWSSNVISLSMKNEQRDGHWSTQSLTNREWRWKDRRWDRWTRERRNVQQILWQWQLVGSSIRCWTVKTSRDVSEKGKERRRRWSMDIIWTLILVRTFLLVKRRKDRWNSFFPERWQMSDEETFFLLISNEENEQSQDELRKFLMIVFDFISNVDVVDWSDQRETKRFFNLNDGEMLWHSLPIGQSMKRENSLFVDQIERNAFRLSFQPMRPMTSRWDSFQDDQRWNVHLIGYSPAHPPHQLNGEGDIGSIVGSMLMVEEERGRGRMISHQRILVHSSFSDVEEIEINLSMKQNEFEGKAMENEERIDDRIHSFVKSIFLNCLSTNFLFESFWRKFRFVSFLIVVRRCSSNVDKCSINVSTNANVVHHRR